MLLQDVTNQTKFKFGNFSKEKINKIFTLLKYLFTF